MPDLARGTRIFRSEQLRSSIFTLLYSRRKSCNDVAWVTNCPWEETSFPSFQNLTSSLKLNEAKMVSKQTSKRLESVLEVGPISKLSIFPALVVKKCWRYLFPNFSMLKPRNSMLGCFNCLYFLINLNAWGSWLSVLSSFFVRLLQYSRYMSSRVWRSSTKSKCLAPYTLAVHPVVWK